MEGSEVTLSHFLRYSGAVLTALGEGDVLLTRRDGPNLVLTTADRTRAIRDSLQMLAKVVLEAVEQPDATSGIAGHLSRAFPGTSFLSPAERLRLLHEIAASAAAAAAAGTTEPLARSLESLRRTVRVRAETPPVSAHLSRPVAIPDDVDDPSVKKASGVVDLPLHVRWTYPQRTYDLDDASQRRLAYEQVLSEGDDDDVRRIIDVETLIADWDQLVLPIRVRKAWAEWLLRRRKLVLSC